MRAVCSRAWQKLASSARKPAPPGRGVGDQSLPSPILGRGAGGEGSLQSGAAQGGEGNSPHPTPSELHWFKPPGKGQLAYFGMNVDFQGNIFYCDHQTRSIHKIPLVRLNAAGNPVYDWSQTREIVAADTSPVKFFPLMAVRTEKGEIYAFGRSDLFAPFPGAGPAWMGGWALAKFDPAGRRLWATRLAQHCTGMDYVPGDGGVVLGYFAEAIVYHYNRDGLLVGSARPGKPAGGVSGWLDNTASIACNRDPRDGLINVFAEEDYAHRILWYRFDDTKITVKKVPVRGRRNCFARGQFQTARSKRSRVGLVALGPPYSLMDQTLPVFEPVRTATISWSRKMYASVFPSSS